MVDQSFNLDHKLLQISDAAEKQLEPLDAIQMHIETQFKMVGKKIRSKCQKIIENCKDEQSKPIFLLISKQCESIMHYFEILGGQNNFNNHFSKQYYDENKYIFHQLQSCFKKVVKNETLWEINFFQLCFLEFCADCIVEALKETMIKKDSQKEKKTIKKNQIKKARDLDLAYRLFNRRYHHHLNAFLRGQMMIHVSYQNKKDHEAIYAYRRLVRGGWIINQLFFSLIQRQDMECAPILQKHINTIRHFLGHLTRQETDYNDYKAVKDLLKQSLKHFEQLELPMLPKYHEYEYMSESERIHYFIFCGISGQKNKAIMYQLSDAFKPKTAQSAYHLAANIIIYSSYYQLQHDRLSEVTNKIGNALCKSDGLSNEVMQDALKQLMVIEIQYVFAKHHFYNTLCNAIRWILIYQVLHYIKPKCFPMNFRATFISKKTTIKKMKRASYENAIKLVQKLFKNLDQLYQMNQHKHASGHHKLPLFSDHPSIDISYKKLIKKTIRLMSYLSVYKEEKCTPFLVKQWKQWAKNKT